ncbi:LamG-like jellyroll fold domain-containing protein [Thermomonospora amylolytica]|uniref:LamG-like jellyroll fold domain-containing protein n=1 Tax=Thermomonospora amylolytica TaxID=1411117 RepID=UPI0013003327|nr:LamG-like jellyroll fold domain-containing protein [Thermomonospora amylolytica]
MSVLQVQAVGGLRSASAEEKAPDSVASAEEAVAAAKRSGERVAVSSLTGPQREVVALPDGRLEATLHVKPVRALKGGRWTAIDTKLRKRADGALEPGATTVGLVFSGGGSGPFVRMTRAGREMSLSWPHGALPAPTVEGDTAVYANALPDVDLVVRATPSGFSHVLRVKTPQAARLPQVAALRLGLGAHRMRLQADSGGGLKMVDEAAGGTVFTAPAPMMWDSSDRETTGQSPAPSADGGDSEKRDRTGGPNPQRDDLSRGPADGARRAPIKIAAARGALTLEPDRNLLTDPRTKFPVYIDPDWQAPGESAAVMVGTSYSDASWEDEGVGLCDDADPYMSNCGGRVVKRLFYKFVLPSAVQDTNVFTAEFKPYATHSYNCTPSELQVWKTKGVSGSTSWSGQNASGFWQRKLASPSFAYGNEAVGCANSTVTISTAALKEEVQNAANGSGTIWLGMRAGSESSVTGWKRFNNDAVLRVLYNLPPKTPTNVHLQAEGGTYPCSLNNASKPYLRVWPTMAAKVTDPQGSDRVQAEFLVGWGDASGGNFQWRIGGGFPIGSDTLGPDATPIYSGGGNSGSVLTKSLSSLASSRGIPKNIPIAWMVRGHDFKDGLEDDNWRNWQGSSPWSDAATTSGGLGYKCWFVYDDTSPPPPTVTSAMYPDDGAEHGGAGQAGTFTIAAGAGSEPLAKFGYQFTPPGQAAREIKWLTLGSSPGCTATQCTFSEIPDVHGDWKLNVWAVDRAGRQGNAPTYQFRVRRVVGEEAHWRLDDPAGSRRLRDETVAGDTYQLRAGHSGKCLNVEGGSVNNGAHVLQTDCAEAESERWKLTAKDSGEYTLVNEKSGKCLNVAGGSVNNGAHVIQWDCLDLPENLWTRAEVTDGYQLVNKKSGKCLNVAGGSMDNGAHVIQWDCLDLPENRWSFTSVNQLDLVGDDVALGNPARVGSNSLKLNTDGDANTVGYAETALPVVDPTKSYSVSAWAKPSAGGVWGTVAAQEGTQMRAFRLEYMSSGHWAMSALPYDSADIASNPVARVQSGSPARVGQWTHLVGVYDATAKTISLYVDGKLQGTTAYDAAGWATASRGPFTVGRGLHQAAKRDYFPGEIDDVRVFDRAVTAANAADWYRSTVWARWRLNAPAGQNTVVADDTGAGHALTLYGGAEIKTDEETCVQLTGQCLALDGRGPDGVGEWARTAAPVVRTDGSFTVAGWVDAPTPTTPMTVFAFAGGTQSTFTVRFNPRAARNPYYDPERDDPSAEYIGAWEAEAVNADGPTPTRTIVHHSQSCNVCTNSGPDHLALVYDAGTDTMSLYVNGTVDGSGTNSSAATGIVGVNAMANFQVGRRFADGDTGDGAANREYFTGLIDDIWLLNGALSASEIAAFRNLQEVDTFHGNPQLPLTYD